MATHGSISEFVPGREDWVSYTERLEQYFTANGIKQEEGDKRRAILLSCCGAATYQLIRNLVSPAKPTEKSFEQLAKLVKDHHQPPPSEIVQRFNFHMRTRKQGESIGEFVAQLRKLSEHCRFGESLPDMLRDRLVCGCNDHRLQCKLLSEESLSFDKALKIAKAVETAERDSRGMQKPSSQVPKPVHSITRRSNPTTKMPSHKDICYRCGGKHTSVSCKYKDSECHFCKKKGHLAKVCKAKA